MPPAGTRTASDYHPHFDDSTVAKIIKNADAIYQSEGKAGRLIFRKGSDIVVVEGPSAMTTTLDMPRLGFRTTNPDGFVFAQVARGEAITSTPSWCIETLNAGPARSSPEYSGHVQQTVGSSYDWSDELRFDKNTGRLSSFILKTAETGLLAQDVAASWLRAARVFGIPVLEEREQGFNIDPMDVRCMTDDCGALVVADVDLKMADGSSLRLAIDADVDFLFQNERYVGWILHRPIAHLVAEPGDEVPGVDEPNLDPLMIEYINLVVQPNIDRMSDEDPAVLSSLRALRSRVGNLQSKQASVLEKTLNGVLETFYS